MDNMSITCFLRVCELHNFTKAAQQLHISQPALSRRIIALEDELGVRLLDRSNGGLRLTEGGALFYEEAKKVLSFETTLKEKMEKYRQGFYGKIRIGYDPHGFIEPLVFAAHLMKDTYPEIELEFKEMSQKYALYSYMHDLIDVAYVFRLTIPKHEGSAVEVIVKNRPVILIPKGHRLWEREFVTCADLVGERFAIPKEKSGVSLAALNLYEGKGLSFEDALQCESSTSRLFQIAAGGYIGIGGTYSPEKLSNFASFIRQIPCVDVEYDAADYCAAYHLSNRNAERFVNFAAIFSEDNRGESIFN